ncbi:MAG: hypothetical protein ACLRWO_13180 [Clostridium butyricum]
MDKFCVFCGKKPKNKTKEHIIPRWLIEYTGDFNRQIGLGYNYKNKDLRKFSFNNLTLPACEECNSKFGMLENKVKTILINILEHDRLNTNDMTILLDWFDKVRVGLWLLYYVLNSNYMNIVPKFHIMNRIGMNDRVVIIYKDYYPRKCNVEKGINFYGVDSQAFQLCPSCFSLRINEYYFFNISKEFLFSRRIGFPYPVGGKYIEEVDGILFDIHDGIKRKMLPLLRGNNFMNGVEVYQPIFQLNNNKELLKCYNNDYVKNSCINFDKGIGKVFKYDRNNKRLLENVDLDMEEAIVSKYLVLDRLVAKQTFEFQNKILKMDNPDYYKNTSKEFRDRCKDKESAALMANEFMAEIAVTNDVNKIDLKKIYEKYSK